MTTRKTVALTKYTEHKSLRKSFLTVSQCTFRLHLVHSQSGAIIARMSPPPQMETRSRETPTAHPHPGPLPTVPLCLVAGRLWVPHRSGIRCLPRPSAHRPPPSHGGTTPGPSQDWNWVHPSCCNWVTSLHTALTVRPVSLWDGGTVPFLLFFVVAPDGFQDLSSLLAKSLQSCLIL